MYESNYSPSKLWINSRVDVSLTFVSQLSKEKENSESKPVKTLLKFCSCRCVGKCTHTNTHRYIYSMNVSIDI